MHGAKLVVKGSPEVASKMKVLRSLFLNPAGQVQVEAAPAAIMVTSTEAEG